MKRYLAAAFFVLLALYIVFQARYLILGPRVKIAQPADNATVDTGVLLVSGTAENISFLSLDDRPIYTDKEGHWQEKLIASAGINIIKLSAKDRFGREKEIYVRVLAK